MWNIEKIPIIVQKYKIVSFDIFDTLIKRDLVNPTDIFGHVETEYNARHSGRRIKGFTEQRINAERKARKLRYPNEVSLRDIYELCDLPNKNELMKIEEDLEVFFSFPNIPVVEAYKKCQASGKRIVLTSDMYLSQNVIERMLNKCGIDGYEKLYLSSSVGEKKTTGMLFDYVLRDLNVRSRDLIHIGDSRTTDNLVPRKKGCNSFYIKRIIQNTEFISSTDLKHTDSNLFMFVNNRLPLYSSKSRTYRWGYEIFGPLLYGFCEWIYQILKERECDTVFLLARDMYLVREIFKRLYPDISVVYLEISRRSLRRLFVRRRKDILSILDTTTRKTYSLQYLLELIDISDKSLAQLEKKYDLSARVNLQTVRPNWIDDFNEDVLSILNVEEDYAYDYLEQSGFFDTEEPIIADIGWHGTIQNMLEIIGERPLTGLYFGISKRDYFNDMNIKGYWFSFDKEEDSYRYISLISVLETMLFPQMGTTIAYKKENERIVPVYKDAEVSDYSFIGDFQQGGLQFVDDFARKFGNNQGLRSNTAVYGFTKMAFYPNSRQVDIIGNIPYEEEKIYHLVQRRPKYKYCINPKGLLLDYDNSRWKTGFIKWMFPFLHRPNDVEVLIRNRRKLKR